MRLRVFRPIIPALVALLFPPAPLTAQEAVTRVTRVTPVALVPFRGGGGMSLREAAPVSPPPPTTSIVRPSPPQPPAPPAPSVAKTAPPVSPPKRPAAEPAPRKPTAPAGARVATLPPAPPRSILPARSEPPPSALPPGARELSLQPTTFTPYDRYLGSVRAVLDNLEDHEPTMTLAARLMKEGRRFKYCVCDPYRADPPALTAARRAGDCKSKALWLYDNLGDSGALFVIGKATKRARTSHAWVYWRYDERWWILDCTERADPIAADSVSPDRYVPYYSFGKGSSYRHKATRLMLTGAIVPSAKPIAAKR